jgi:hypothetical protein
VMDISKTLVWAWPLKNSTYNLNHFLAQDQVIQNS